MANFGALTDHFGILAIVDGEGTLATVLELVDSSATPDAQSRADAQDENGDIADAHWHGNTVGNSSRRQARSPVKGAGTLNTALLACWRNRRREGDTSVEVTTSNSDWPKVVVSGKLGTGNDCCAYGQDQQMDIPGGVFRRCRPSCAVVRRSPVDAACRLTGSAFPVRWNLRRPKTASANLSRTVYPAAS